MTESAEFIKNAYRIKAGRKRTQLTAYQNMQLQTTHPIKDTNKKKIKPSIPSNYADYNYHNRMKQRHSIVREISHNNFELPNVVMLTLTYDSTKLSTTVCTDLEQSHKEFKKFIQRICSHYDNFRYLATFNRQTNGNWHYHVLCNFPSGIPNNTINQTWKNGLTYTTRIKSRADYDQAIEYLISNMDRASSELKSKHGYLCSKNCERDIIIDSWHESTWDKFTEAFNRIENANNTILYEAKNHLGVTGTTINESTGEIAEYHIPDRELTPTLQEAGYESWDTIYTHLSSSADFSDKFAPLLPATPKPKRNKKI